MHAFLVGYEYGLGTVWAFVIARSAEQIATELPAVDVHEGPPKWMTEHDQSVIREHCTIELAAGEGLDHILDRHRQMVTT